jgi:protein TonB
LYRVGGDVIAARALYQPRPVYPQLAIMAHVQGTVMLQAIVGRDGSIQDLKVLSGPALLVRAALDAVKTWRYQPTLLNSEPVDVLTEIDVNFNLGE